MRKLKIFFKACVIITGVIMMSSFIQQQDMKHWEAPKSADSQKNPFTGNSTATEKGSILFENQCVMCHGSKGKGDGTVAVSLKPKPADLTSKMTQSHTDGALYWKIMQGNTPMPAFKEAHKTGHNQCWQLINYIRELGKQAQK
jgi:mono/diheme cytochrome c family protein